LRLPGDISCVCFWEQSGRRSKAVLLLLLKQSGHLGLIDTLENEPQIG